jgi:nitrate reductase (NAD(P)H)
MAQNKHPGASDIEILNEPDWVQTHTHRVGVRGRDNRLMGVTHTGDEKRYELEEELAEEKLKELSEKVKKGDLLTVRDIMSKQEVCATHA